MVVYRAVALISAFLLMAPQGGRAEEASLSLKEEVAAQHELLKEQGEALHNQRRRLNDQESILDEQRRLIAEQQALLEWHQRQLSTLLQRGGAVEDAMLSTLTATGSTDADPPKVETPPVSAPGPNPPSFIRVEPPEEQVGEAPKAEDKPPEIPVLADVGGVLTPRGVLIVEPQLEFVTSTINRFVFQGIEIADAVLVGTIEASDADRLTIVPAVTARLGVTNRFEIDARVPMVIRDDRITSTVVSQSDQATISRDVDGAGIGDIELGAHYQINRGQDGMPFLIGNVRVKTDTGTSPFEVSRDGLGIETELATGSGFWSVEPSLTAIYPSDPAVFYGNIGYLFNIGRDIGERINTGSGSALIGNVDPGDSVGVSFGMGLGINRRASVNFGYDHDFIMKTTTEIDGVDFESETLQVGSFLFGLSYSTSETSGLNVTLALGATDDAPDMQITVRVPMTFELF